MTDPAHPEGPPGDGSSPPGDIDPQIAEFARRLQASDDPRADALRPLSREARERIEARVLGRAEKAKVARLPTRAPRARWVALAAAALMGVCLAMYFGSRSTPEPVAYALEVTGDRSVRGDTPPPPDEPVRLRPSTELSVTIRPKTPVRDAALRVLLLRGGDAQLVKTTFSSDGEGAFTIKNKAAEVFGAQTDGAAELVITVGAPMPDDETVQRIAADPARKAPAGLTVLRRALRFEGWAIHTLYGGCEAMQGASLCEITSGTTLHFWASLPPKRVTLRVDGREVEAPRIEASGGTRYVLAPTAGAREIGLWADGRTPVLKLALGATLDWPAWLREADQQRSRNDLDAAEKALEGAEQDARPEIKLQDGLDAPGTVAETGKKACSTRPRAVVVSDPRGDLPDAARAGPEVAGALTRRGLETSLLLSREATKKAIIEALSDPCVALFHYDGHAVFAGRDGTLAALELAFDEALTVEELTALPRVPEAAVLSGCETAKDDGLGLAQAFLVRGARQVLATTEVVPDALSARLVRRLYDDRGAADPGRGPPDLATALRSSVRALREERPSEAAWRRFRVLSR